jgi:hypothetical protein
MKKIALLKNKKDVITKNITLSYIFMSTNNRIDNIKLSKNDNNLNFLVNHYGDNDNLYIKNSDYNINETIINSENSTDLYSYNENNDTLNLKTYISEDTITFTDMLYIDNNKYMLGRYHQSAASPINVDGELLDTEPDFTSILCKSDDNSNMLWNRKIKHDIGRDNAKGPLISTMTKDDVDHIYMFGLSTNYTGATHIINLETNAIINPKINKKSTENISIITKVDDDKVIWRKLIIGTTDTLFLNHKIKYIDNNIIISFNFSKSIIIDGKTYTTSSNQIINSIVAKLDLDGNYIWVKHIKSNKYVSIISYTLDNDYIYCLGNFKGEANFDDIDLFYSGLESGYIMKMRINDGLILNIINVYSDGTLRLNNITNDNDNLFISGTWSGNIYFNGKIKNSTYSDFFITNIKKNEI